MLVYHTASPSFLDNLTAQKVFLFVLALVPVWFLSGFEFIVFPAMAVGMLMLAPGPFLRPTRVDFLFLLLISTLIVSATVRVVEGVDFVRVFAAYYNVVLLFVGVVVMQQVRSWIASTTPQQEMEQLPIGRICAVLLLIGLGFVIFGRLKLLFVGGFLFQIPTLFGLAFPGKMTGLLEVAQTAQFVIPDWYGTKEPTYRSVVFAPYATAGAAVTAVLFHMGYLYAMRRGKVLWQIGLAITFCAMLAMVLTRAVFIGVVLGAVVGNFVFGDVRRQAVIIAGGVAVVLAIALGAVNLESAADYRMGSTMGRLQSYLVGVHLVSEQSPIIGLGIKPRDDSLLKLQIPVGSHSSVVSLFVKGGLIGLVLMLSAFVLYHALLWIRVWLLFRADSALAARMSREARILIQLNFTIWVWMFYDDIDAPALACVLAFMSFGYIQGWAMRLQRMEGLPLGRSAHPR